MSYGDEYGYSGGERGPNLRWIGGLIIALIGIAMYALQTQVNPVTGRRQHIAISPSQEKALGLQAAPEMASKMGGAVERDDPRAQFVAQVGRRLVDRTEASRSDYADNFHFVLLNDPETVNAFALPGGQVFITLGLFDKLTNEAQLAGVLGHEIGHVINRHTAEQMAKGQLGNMLTLAVGVGTSGDDRGRQAQMAAMLVNQMSQLHFSREDESEADSYGLKIMPDAGYDPSAMLDVMRILKEVSKGDRQPEFLETHPHPENRLEAIQAYLDKAYPSGIPEGLTKGRRLEDGRVLGSRDDG